MEYKAIIGHIARHEYLGGYGRIDTADGIWEAHSKYPNIAAELQASSKFLDTLAEFADISREIAIAILMDCEDMTGQELRGMCRCFGCGADYLTAPIFSTVDPKTKKGKVRLRHLEELQQTAAPLFHLEALAVNSTMETMRAGKEVTYAQYRWAEHYLRQNNATPQCIRDFRFSNMGKFTA